MSTFLSSNRRALIAGAAALLVPARSFGGDANGCKLRARYRMTTASLEVAEVELDQTFMEDELRRIELSMRNSGLASLLSGHHRIQMTTKLAKGTALAPLSFRSKTRKPDRVRKVTINYDRSSQVKEVKIDNNGRKRPSKVPQELWRDTIDPLTSLARIQQWTQTAQPGDTHILKLFDGRKRADLHLRQTDAANRVEMSVEAVFGFDEGDGDWVSWPGESPKILALSFDQQTPPLPELMQSMASSWPAKLQLHHRELQKT